MLSAITLLLFSSLCCAASNAQTYSNPVIWEDLADLDIFRVNNTFYYSASSMHYSPGAPILQSEDLINWEYAGHSVPELDFSPAYYLNGSGQASPSIQGPWKRIAKFDKCYYDCGLLVDDDDKLYVAYGNTNINVAQLSADATSEVTSKTVWQSSITIEGSRMYKVKGNYYIFNTQPANGEYVLKSTNGPFGPYTQKALFTSPIGPKLPAGSNPHQGGITSTPKGDWYYMAFVDSYPGGRMPVMAPITWDSEGWPVINFVGGTWGQQYPLPNIDGVKPASNETFLGADNFAGSALGPQWEWNHNPDHTKYTVGNGLTLKTATVTSDLYAARNTLTHRILGPQSVGTISMDISSMANGDRAGLSVFRDVSGWIGIAKDNGQTRILMVDNITMDTKWNTVSKGTEVASSAITGTKVWLRASVDIHPGANRNAVFSYSTDGQNFKVFGKSLVLNNNWTYFMGYRFGIFNYATTALGGSVKVAEFALSQS
ncbi:xylosidase glycosyl protein [Rutstroemia sp. NJR-2017a WRK4]|nr:xylosidase glycosyl protein [Rutstroemia sp. NJR-2017a WRK4]